MRAPDPQRQAFEFLSRHLQSQTLFGLAEFQEATGWPDSSFRTYLSKQYRAFLDPVGDDKYRVSEAFRPFVTWRKFRQHVTQVRRVVTDYSPVIYENVLIYEFFMPLTHENALRTTLDALFFKDTIMARLRTVGIQRIQQLFPRRDGETDEQFLQGVCDWLEKKFQGYSIYHVDGVPPPVCWTLS